VQITHAGENPAQADAGKLVRGAWALRQGRPSVASVRSSSSGNILRSVWRRTETLWPLTFDLWISGLIVENLYVKSGDPSCIDFRDIVWKTDKKHMNAVDNPIHAIVVLVSVRKQWNKMLNYGRETAGSRVSSGKVQKLSFPIQVRRPRLCYDQKHIPVM